MKRIFLFLGAIMLVSVTMFTSCTEDTEPADLPPSISFVTGANYISDDATMTADTTFKVKILAESNTTSNTKLASLKITRVFGLNSQDTTYNDPNGESTFTAEITFTAVQVEGVERIEFKVTDKDGQSATIDLQITTVLPAGDIDYWSQRILGSWNNLDIGSSFASVNGNVYKLNEAFANQTIIDFMYWWGESTAATLGAPNDPNAALVFNTGNYALTNWTTKNATKFKMTTMTGAQFDAVTDSGPCIENAAGAEGTRAGALADDQVVGFVTVTGKHGLIKVNEITEGSSGSIKIDVKVEK